MLDIILCANSINSSESYIMLTCYLLATYYTIMVTIFYNTKNREWSYKKELYIKNLNNLLFII